jgi:hypothetical protein
MMHSHAISVSLPIDDQAVLVLNDFLDKTASPSSLNETLLERLLSQLDETARARDSLYWLTMARINELALFCAGNYADTCELVLVGDLLVNPRRVLVHVKGQSRPVVKERHTPLSRQFGRVAETRGGVIEWVKTQTVSEITVEALVPELYSRLAACGQMTESYLASIRERKTKIAKLTGLLACSPCKDGKHLFQWLETASAADREFMEASFCRLGLTGFFEMGRDVRRLVRDPSHKSRFLVDREDGAPQLAPSHQ